MGNRRCYILQTVVSKNLSARIDHDKGKEVDWSKSLMIDDMIDILAYDIV